jgi:hypothetical protein
MISPSDSNFDGQSSTQVQIREIQEIAITLAAKNLNPAMLSEDFLKFSGIVPNEWELSKQPILTPNFAQVNFQNGVSIASQPRTIAFVETINLQAPDQLNIPKVARQYVEKLPHAEYQTLSISPKSIIPFTGGEDSARRYITGTLLAPGAWQEFGNAPMQAGLNLLYQLEKCQFSLNINEAKIQIGDRAAIPALLFAGSFNYNVAIDSEPERLQLLIQGLNEWQTDLATFRDIVNKRFLGQASQRFFGEQDQEALFPRLN